MHDKFWDSSRVWRPQGQVPHSLLALFQDGDGKGKAPKEEDIQPAPFTKVLKLNFPEWPYLIGGSIGGIIYGLLPLAFAVVLSEILTVRPPYKGATAC